MEKTREDWLIEAKIKLQEKVFKTEIIPEKVKISCGFGRTKKTLGVCCPEIYSEGKFTEIFIDPRTAESSRVLDILAHELIHAILGSGKGHGKEFKNIMERIGLNGPAKATTASPELKEKLKDIINEIGEYPHKKYEVYVLPRVTPDAEKKQMWICNYRHYEISIKNKFSEAITPVCPICHKPMRIKIKGEKADCANQFDLEEFTGNEKEK